MHTLTAHANVVLGPYVQGAVLTITQPASSNIFDFPQLGIQGSPRTVSIELNVPKKLTLAQGNTYVLTAGGVAITYQIA